MQARVSTCLLFAMLAGFGCTGSDDEAQRAFDAGPVPPAGQGCPPSTPAFAYGDNGLSVTDTKLGIVARVVDASSSPPKKHKNDWTVVFEDAAGKPLRDAQITWASTYMAEHTHGYFPEAVTATGGGHFDLDGLNFTMEGGWEVFLWVDPDGGSREFDPTRGSQLEAWKEPSGARPNIVFSLCVPKE